MGKDDVVDRLICLQIQPCFVLAGNFPLWSISSSNSAYHLHIEFGRILIANMYVETATALCACVGS